MNSLVVQQEESWKHYKLLVQHFKSAVKQNAWEEIQYCRENIAWVRKRHFSGIFPFSMTFSLKKCRSVLTPLIQLQTLSTSVCLVRYFYSILFWIGNRKRHRHYCIYLIIPSCENSMILLHTTALAFFNLYDSQQCPPVKPKPQFNRMQSVETCSYSFMLMFL